MRVPGDGLEGEDELDFVVIGEVSGFSTNVLALLSLSELGSLNSRHVRESGANELNELLVIVNTSSDNIDSLGVDVLVLELLKGEGGEVSNVVLKSSEGHTEASESEGSSEEDVIELLASVDDILDVVRVLVLVLSDVGSDNRSGLESAVSHHSEDVNGIMRQAVSLPVNVLLVVIHSEISSRHLNHSVVDGLVGVEDGLVESVLDGKEGTRVLGGLVTGSDIDENTQIDNTGENGALSEDGDAVGELGDLVSGFSVFSELDSVTLKWASRVEGGVNVSGGSGVVSVEEIENSSADNGEVSSRGERSAEEGRSCLRKHLGLLLCFFCFLVSYPIK